MKQGKSLILTVLFSLLVPAGAWAYQAGDYFKAGGVSYSILQTSSNPQYNRVSIQAEGTSYSNHIPAVDDISLTHFNVPEKVYAPDGTEFQVTNIGLAAFSGCESLVSVTIPESIVGIDGLAFYGCKSLAAIEIPNSVGSIGDYCFVDCVSLKSFTFPNSVKRTSSYTFKGCTALEQVTLSENMTAISSNFFMECSALKRVKIPASVTTIGSQAFYMCTNLEQLVIPATVTKIFGGAFASLPQVTMESGNSVYDQRDGCNAIIETATNTLVQGFANSTIPNTVTSIGDYAFFDCDSLKAITIPNSVTSIGNSAFNGCEGISSIELPNGLTIIGSSAFSGCKHISSLVIPATVTSIGSYAFSFGNTKTGTEIYSLITEPFEINDNVFYRYSNQPIYVPKGLKEKYEATKGWTYESNNYKRVIVEADLDKSGLLSRGTFFKVQDMNFMVTNRFLPQVSVGGYDAFNEKWVYVSEKELVGEVSIPSTVKGPDGKQYAVTQVGGFYNQGKVTKVNIPDGVTEILSSAFSECYGLKQISIPESVSEIGAMAFVRCGLTSIHIPEAVTLIRYQTFMECSKLTTVTMGKKVTRIAGLNEIMYGGAFYNCNSLSSITVPDSLKEVGRGAFAYCSNLKDFDLPKKLTTIGQEAFYECPLTAVFIPKTVTSIGNVAFSCHDGLESVKVEDGNKFYDSRGGCNALIETATKTLLLGCKNAFIPTNVNHVGVGAFSSCKSLKNITIPSSVQTIGNFAFNSCISLSSLSIPASVMSIGTNAFTGCSEGLNTIKVDAGNKVYDSRDNCNALIITASDSLILGCRSTVIPNTVKGIGNSAFIRCRNLTSVTIPETVKCIGSSAFYQCSGLTSLFIPATTTYIGSSAFNRCSNLESIDVSYVNPVFDSREGCNALVRTATNELIVGCRNTVIPNSIETIGSNAFAEVAGLKSLTIPESVKDIKYSAFADCPDLESVKLPSSLTIINQNLFWGCSSLVSLRIPRRVETISYSAFRNCTGLRSITLPRSVSKIQSGAFAGCSSLQVVRSLIQEPFSVDGVFSELPNDAVLYVAEDTKLLYDTTDGWRDFYAIEELKLEALTGNESLVFDGEGDINASSVFDGNIIDNLFFNIGAADGGFDAEEGCIMLKRTTTDKQMAEVTEVGIFDEEAMDVFSGIVFKLAEGDGAILIDGATMGNMALKVKVGNDNPVELLPTERQKVRIDYSIGKPEYVYIYGGELELDGVRAQRRNAREEDSLLRIYGLDWITDLAGIETVEDNTDGGKTAPVYNLNGQRMLQPVKGINIVGRRKILK